MPDSTCPAGHHVTLRPLWGVTGVVGYLFECDCTTLGAGAATPDHPR